MHGINREGSARKAARQRKLKVAPVTRAVRSALAASAAMLALAGSGPAIAGDCIPPASGTIHCKDGFADTLDSGVEDLTLVALDQVPSSVALPSGIVALAGGIEAIGSGDIDIENDSYVYVLSAGQAIGIYAHTDDGDVTIANSSEIGAYSLGGLADGIFASGGDVHVGNDGAVVAMGYDWAAGIEAQGDGATTVANAGTLYARTYGASEAFGVYATGDETTVDNSGIVYVHGYDQSTGIYARGDTAVGIHNSGGVYAGYVGAYGASSSDTSALMAMSNGAGGEIAIDNSGQLQALALFASSGIDARATGAGGTASVTNSGSIVSISLAYGAYATGIAASGDGAASVDNSGNVGAHSEGTSTGIVASSFAGDASIVNSGYVGANSSAFDHYASYGLVAFAPNGGASVDNSGNVVVDTLFAGIGIDANGQESVAVANSGAVTVDAWREYGVRAISGGDVSVDNAGSIDVAYAAAYGYVGRSYGVLAISNAGDVAVANGGGISSATTGTSVGIFASAAQGDASVSGDGDVGAVSASGSAFGIYAAGLGAEVQSGGNVEAGGYGYTGGIVARGTEGASVVVSGGDVSASALANATGVGAYSADGDATIDNAGAIHAYSMYGNVTHLLAVAPNGSAAIGNSGQVGDGGHVPLGNIGILAVGASAAVVNNGDVLLSGGSAHGVYAAGSTGAAVDNAGSIDVAGVFGAYGVYAASAGATTVANSGDIQAMNRANLSAGILAVGDTVGIANSGAIEAHVEDGYAGVAVGVVAQAQGDVALQNSGSISGGSGIAAYLYSAGGSATIENTGDLRGAIVTFAGDDAFANGGGGEWLVDNGLTDFGDGDDALVNGADGTIHLAGGGIFLGNSGAAGNSFENAGILRTSGYGVIDMGRGVSPAPSPNPLPLANDGIIDFIDGTPDDMLVILGDLGGDGAINVDMSLLNGGSDLLYVDGKVFDGTTQAINVNIDGMPTALRGEAAPVVVVTGDLPAGAFTGGNVLNFDPSNFLDLGVAVGTTQAGGRNVVSAAVTVDGLNGTGVLAASVAQGAHRLINSAIGTLRQRNGVQYPLGTGQSGLSPWVRLYTEKGKLSPKANGFGSGADFGFEQENRGREIGMGATLGNASFGILAGNADGTQRIDGLGEDRFRLHVSGLYATWNGSRVYVDVSHRWMDFDARLDSPSGAQETSGNAQATNIEAGFTGWSMGGIAIVPQVQYTRSTIDNVEAVAGSATQMKIDGGASERGRAGVVVSRSFTGGNGFEWTPYGGLSAVREFDGKSGFTVADTFSGATSVEGTSTLAELGMGMRKGGLSATAGIHWTDGGALDSMRGGQLVVRYTW